ncbi:MAG: hypothetical protein PHR35_04185 [Kiritimatiellae bacterium]|nr:hypothetical protein [Kiritimatiellia bacterium]
MDAGLLTNLAVTTAVQAAIGTGITLIMRRYVAAVDRVTERVRVLEEKRIAEIEMSISENRKQHEEFIASIGQRIGREEQRDLLTRIEKISDEQRNTAIQQAATVAKMDIAANQIDELFGRIAALATTQARLQGKIEG